MTTKEVVSNISTMLMVPIPLRSKKKRLEDVTVADTKRITVCLVFLKTLSSTV